MCERPLHKVAVIDGLGPHAEVSLYWADDDGDCHEQIPWPFEWRDKYVTKSELEDKGFEVVTA